jgi:prophage regulatory protein
MSLEKLHYHEQIMSSIGLPDRVVREDECKKLIGLSRLARWRLEQQGKFPIPRKISDRTNIWLLSELLEWLYKPHKTTSAPKQLNPNHKTNL